MRRSAIGCGMTARCEPSIWVTLAFVGVGCATTPTPPIQDSVGQRFKSASGLESECLRAGPGSGKVARRGDTVTVHYVGRLTDGTEFDSSRKGDAPFAFVLGQGRVIKGWDEGVTGMEVGCIRRLTVPPHLGYGAKGFPPDIPPGATLVFEVELLDVTSPP